jgi:uncharacterized tellurite resistance protein B-like protein
MHDMTEERAGKLAPMVARAMEDPRVAAKASAIVEAMFLMAVADGDVSEPEVREFAKASADVVGELTEADIEGMFMELAGAVEEEGWERRVRAVGATLKDDPELSETAYRLSMAVALADDFVAHEEAAAMDTFAASFGIDPERAHVIVREVHEELFGKRILGAPDTERH